jgi:hypothetical protein
MNSAACHKKQTGAFTLMGALFIIITLALMVLAINRMAASNITDTTIQNDAVEALFIAETGIEYASYILANNLSSCDNLAAFIGSTTSGRGSFDVTASSLNGTDCSISVAASVSSAGVAAPDASLRIIDVVLRLGATAGWAVGDNGTVLQWDGTNWIAGVSNTTEDLYSIHCESDSDCWAAGNNAETIHWDGSSWSQVNSGTNGVLFGISCDATNSCYSVGFRSVFFGLIEIANTRSWNGTSWLAGGGDAWFDYYSDVSCPSPNCYATMASGSVHQSSTSWGNVFAGATVLNGIDCATPTDCWAVGNLSGNNYYFVQYNGTTWTSQTVAAPNQVRQNLNAISCASSSDCWAVGNMGSGRYVLVHWNGSNWIANSNYLQSGQHREDLNGVHCPTATECWAVGVERNGWNIIRYDGAGWSYLGSSAPGPGDLNDVFVFSGNGGSVSLVRWQERINN